MIKRYNANAFLFLFKTIEYMKSYQYYVKFISEIGHIGTYMKLLNIITAMLFDTPIHIPI